MNIGKAAQKSQLPAKTIRYYEEVCLIKPSRAENGYRDYSAKDVHRLRFLQRSRSLGFTIEECRLLLSLYDNDQRASADVKSLAQDKIGEIDRKIEELKSQLKCCKEVMAKMQEKLNKTEKFYNREKKKKYRKKVERYKRNV